MTRIIKFRAWDKDNECFIEGFDFVKYSDGTLGVSDNSKPFNRYGETELMQFTGLLDKNGKEIYEGDILQVKTLWYKAKRNDKEQEKGTTLWTVEHKIYNTEMGFFTFGIDRRFHKPLTKSRLFNAKAEVIGNIYENPELVKC